MSDYCFDSSALAERYLPEVGTAWVRGLIDPGAGHYAPPRGLSSARGAQGLAGAFFPFVLTQLSQSPWFLKVPAGVTKYCQPPFLH